MNDQRDEVILAQEQGAMMRKAGAKEELEGEFGLGGNEGTLVLTNRRLIFDCIGDKEDDLPSESELNPLGKIRVLYSEIEEVEQIPRKPPNLFITLQSVSVAKGHKGGLGRPSLSVDWSDDAGSHSVVFTEVLTGRRMKNLNDWAPIIDGLKSGKQKIVALPPPPSVDSLEGKIVRVLSDMQEKGVLTIEEAVETEFKTDLDPDAVEAACNHLVTEQLLVRTSDSGEVYYRRRSPLGEEDLSS